MAASKLKKVWIEEGCISCSVCMDICPQVFDVKDGEDCPVEVIQYDAGGE